MNATTHRRKSVIPRGLSAEIPIVPFLVTVAMCICPVVLHTDQRIRSHISETFRPYAVMRLDGEVSQ